MRKKALITGITGQDGSYLAEYLLQRDYEVHGIVRRSSAGYGALRNIIHLVDDPDIYRSRLFLHSGDLTDAASLTRIIAETLPDEVYNLGAQADVQESFLMPEMTFDVNGTAVIRLLEIIRRISPHSRFYQASTSELFGNTDELPQKETSRMVPQSPYSIGKLAAYTAVCRYREAYNMYAVNGILFNHESERRGDDYVTRKITRAVARIANGLQSTLRLGNLDAKRDWGYAKEYVEAEWLMLQRDEPQDFVIGTGETHTVEQWLDTCIEWLTSDIQGWKEKHLIIDPRLFRPAEVYELRSDPSLANSVLGWKARTNFAGLTVKMLENDFALTKEKFNSN